MPTYMLERKRGRHTQRERYIERKRGRERERDIERKRERERDIERKEEERECETPVSVCDALIYTYMSFQKNKHVMAESSKVKVNLR